uniref:Uncharacterized protein n=1 Tax=Biomphalaria glabrata TaxID=6526 RepID=A0A2C9K613_BIOGL
MSDEVDCHLRECDAGEVKCDNHKCIPQNWVCDGGNDCGTNWDERNCVQSCEAENFMCADGSKCVPDHWVCDHAYDCHDRTDEVGCICNETTHFQCPDGRCINGAWRCDRDNDCGDASDELGCPTLHPSICLDYLGIRDCALLNETTHPICLNHEDGYKYCREYCRLCATRIKI